MTENSQPLPDQGASAAVVYIANCPEHGLHGERDTCFVCGKEVQHTVFVRSDMYLEIRGRLQRQRDDLRADVATLKEEQVAFVRALEKAQAESERLREVLDHVRSYLHIIDTVQGRTAIAGIVRDALESRRTSDEERYARCTACGYTGDRVFRRDAEGQWRDVLGGETGVTPDHCVCSHCGGKPFEMVTAPPSRETGDTK